MWDELEIHVLSMAFQDNYWIALKRHDLLSDRMYIHFDIELEAFKFLTASGSISKCGTTISESKF